MPVVGWCDLLFGHVGIFVEQRIEDRLVLLDAGEASAGVVEAVVHVVVVGLGDLADQAIAALGPEAVVLAGMQGDALAHVHLHALARRNLIGAAVLVDGHRGVQHLAVGAGIVALEHQRAAAAVDDVLHLLPVEMVGRDLSLLGDEQLLRIGLDVPGIIEVAVAQGDHQQADLVEIAAAEVGDVPAEHVVLDLVVLAVLALPVLHGPGDEGRQRKLVALDQLERVALNLIQFGSLHDSIPPDLEFILLRSGLLLGALFLDEAVECNRTDEHQTLDELLHVLVDGQHGHAVGEDAHDQHADHDHNQATLTAGHAHAAQHDAGDDIHLVAGARVGLTGVDAGQQHYARQGAHEAGHAVDQILDLLDVDAGEARGLLIAAHAVDVATHAGLVQEDSSK